jgi:hypothetical protein
MGCNQSVNTDILVRVELNQPVFKVSSAQVKTSLRANLKDFCKKVISVHLQNGYSSRVAAFQVVIKGKPYEITSSVMIYDLRLEPTDCITISGVLLNGTTIEVVLKYSTNNAKEETKEVHRSSTIRSAVLKPDVRVLLGYLELDLEQKFEDYDIESKTRLHVIEENSNLQDLQLWKVKKSGLILEALCMNSGCEAYKQRICINLGMGEFDVNSEISQDNQRFCECCDMPLGSVCKVGFAHCVASYFVELSDGKMKEVVERVRGYCENNLKNWSSVVRVTAYA